MKKVLSFLLLSILYSPFSGIAVAACDSRALVTCMDSACVDAALGAGSRCHLCGTDVSGMPERNGMQTLGLSRSRISVDISAAPSDPGKRYQWAAGECLTLVSGCAASDVSRNYDRLIETACRTAATQITPNMFTPTGPRNCKATVQNCVMGDDYCGGDLSKCNDADITRFVSQCAVVENCDDVVNLDVELKNLRASAQTRILDDARAAANAHKTKRESGSKSKMCDGTGKTACVNDMCRNLPGQCADGDVRTLANRMCAYVDEVCSNR
ncbi:MAG: hypothetical protein LBR41_03470 [Rickettsiales bacterium]|jgi:hypothetical protein|nr:hypothetical protein [Rickettsiales bacterium]